MNLGKVKTFLIILFLGINIYLLYSMYFSARFFVDDATIKGTIDILSNYGISVNMNSVPRYTVNLRNIDTENAVYTDSFKSTRNNCFKINGNDFSCEVNSKGIHKKGDSAAIRTIKNFLKDNGFKTKYMNFKKENDTWYIYSDIKGYKIFDSLITLKIYEDKFTLQGRWFEPSTSDILSHSRERNTVYITSVLMELTQSEDIMSNTPFEITSIEFGYLAGKPYGDSSHVTATALPYYQIKDNKGNVYYYDALNGTRLN